MLHSGTNAAPTSWSVKSMPSVTVTAAVSSGRHFNLHLDRGGRHRLCEIEGLHTVVECEAVRNQRFHVDLARCQHRDCTRIYVSVAEYVLDTDLLHLGLADVIGEGFEGNSDERDRAAR